jgi:hypothetical protein
MSLLNRVSFQEVLNAANTIWFNNPIASKVAAETMSILNLAYHKKPRFFNGKCSRGLVGGIFYLLGFRYNIAKKQKEIAHSLSTTEVTFRASYRQWLKEFSEQFTDVINKLSNDRSLRYFILVDLKSQNQQRSF